MKNEEEWKPSRSSSNRSELLFNRTLPFLPLWRAFILKCEWRHVSVAITDWNVEFNGESTSVLILFARSCSLSSEKKILRSKFGERCLSWEHGLVVIFHFPSPHLISWKTVNMVGKGTPYTLWSVQIIRPSWEGCEFCRQKYHKELHSSQMRPQNNCSRKSNTHGNITSEISRVPRNPF